MKKAFVISISSPSGGGKTTVVSALVAQLANCAAIHWDDYGDEVGLNRDINEWAADGFDCSEWNVEPVVADIEKMLKEPYEYIILDYPFGYLNECVGKYIDLSVFIDTPLDVALARRIIRDCAIHSNGLEFINSELHQYLEYSRLTYVKMLEMLKPTSDLVVDGTKTPDEIAEVVFEAVMSKKGKDETNHGIS